MKSFTRVYHARWGDMDGNGHMANRAYLDVAGDARMLYFASRGFSMREFERLRVGPVIRKDVLEYFRETKLLEELTVGVTLAGLSADGSRFSICNEFHNDAGKLVARVTSDGGWLDLDARRLVAPPETLAPILRELTRTEDFAEIPPSRTP